MPIPLIGGATVVSLMAIPLVTKVLVGLGVGIVTYTGVTAATDFGYNYIETQIGQLPTEVLALLGIANFDVYITMLFSAYSAAAVIKGVSAGGSISKFKVLGFGT